MMGERTVIRRVMVYGFSLEDHVPADHLLRSIDRFVICRESASICALIIARRGAIDRPELMIGC